MYAECECSCGKSCTVRYDMLKSGNTRSCGHLSDKTRFSGANLSGKINKYGIKAIRATDKRVDTSVIWECECVCGKIFEVPAYYFDKIQSCGCKKKEQCKENGEKNLIKVREKYYVDGTSVVHIKPGKLFKTNKSGIRGVSWNSKREKWVAQIVFKGKNYNLGRYDKKEDAAAARKEAEEHLYGDFLKWYAQSQFENNKNKKLRIDYRKFTDDSMLSPQEKEVLKYRQEGVPGRKIAEKLGIKIESVWAISHTIVLKCTGQFDTKKRYEYVKKSFEKRMSESEENKRKFKEQQRHYRERNKEKIKENNRKYYENNKERIARQHKEYYEKGKSNNFSQIKSERIKRNDEICRMFSDGESVKNISKKFGLSRQTIYNILKQKHTPEP